MTPPLCGRFLIGSSTKHQTLGLVAGLGLGLLLGCSRKGDDKPAGLAPLPNSAAPSPVAAPAPSPVAAPAAEPAPAAEAAPAGPPIEGVLELPAARKKDVAPTDTIFLVARTVSDTPGVRGSLVAVKRFTATGFPIAFVIGPQDMMIPGGAFSGELTLTARVDKDNDPMTRKKGDVFGAADHVKAGAKGVKVVLSELQKEDESLLGATSLSPHAGMPGMGGPPPGAPPGGSPHGGLPPGHP